MHPKNTSRLDKENQVIRILYLTKYNSLLEEIIIICKNKCIKYTN